MGNPLSLFSVEHISLPFYFLLFLPCALFLWYHRNKWFKKPKMVFEAILADLLNRMLGDYVENLDANQLNIGIWGGDAKLENLRLKESALDDLELPIKAKSGYLSKLVLKVPWKHIYTEPVIVNIEGVYLLAVPGTAVKYDAKKELKNALETKLRLLDRLETKKAIEKNLVNNAQSAGFTEKLVTQIVKNLQIVISNIHVRYEDEENAAESFSCGVMLKGLKFETTDENYNPEYVSTESKSNFIYKLVELDSLSFYWNPELKRTESYQSLDRADMPKRFETDIESYKSYLGLQGYILEPIYSFAHLKLNPRPELDKSNYSIPKIFAKLTLSQLALCISRKQYQGIVGFLDGIESLRARSRYMKYYPPKNNFSEEENIFYNEEKSFSHGKRQWRFAYRCVIGEIIQPRRKNWSWTHMKKHRDTMRKYKRLYKKKLVEGEDAFKKNKKQADELQACEEYLNFFTIALVRQMAELEADVKRVELQRRKTEAAKEQSWWGWATRQEVRVEYESDSDSKKESLSHGANKSGASVITQVRDVMTDEEQEKLYEAIGYDESVPISVYPITFIENMFKFHLKEFKVKVVDDMDTVGTALESTNQHSMQTVMELAVRNLNAKVGHRASASAFRVDLDMGSFEIDGLEPDQSKLVKAPKLVSAPDVSGAALLNLMFETNPLDGRSDQKLIVDSSPLQLVYDADTVIRLMEVFKPPNSVRLEALQAVAAQTFEEYREASKAGIVNALQKHRYTEMKVKIASSYLVVPRNGFLDKSADKLIVEFGEFEIATIGEKPLKEGINPKTSTEEELLEKTYEKYRIELSNVQILLDECMKITGYEDQNEVEIWKIARLQKASAFHLLTPMTFSIVLENSMIPDQVKLPQIRIRGTIPPVALNMSNRQLACIFEIIQSIPLPQFEENDAAVKESGSEVNKSGKTENEEAKAIARPNELLNATMRDVNIGSDLKAINSLSQGDVTKTTAMSSVQRRSEPRQSKITNRSEDEEDRVKMEFSLVLEDVKINMYTSTDYTVSLNADVVHRSQHLASLDIRGLSAGMLIYTNSLVISSELKFVRICDEQDHGQGVKRIRDMFTPSAEQGEKAMLSVNFTQDADQNRTIQVNVSKFQVGLSVAFYMAIAKFFISLQPKSIDVADAIDITNDVKPDVTKAAGDAGWVVPQINLPAPEIPKAGGYLSVKFVAEEPEILLIEDLNNPNSKCLVMKTIIKSNVNLAPEGDVSLVLMCENVEIFQTNYMLRNMQGEDFVQILNPLNLNVVFNGDSSGTKQRVDVEMTDLKLHVAPASIKLLSGISESLSQIDFGATPNEMEEPEPDWSGLWRPKCLPADETPWFLYIGENDDDEFEDEVVFTTPVKKRKALDTVSETTRSVTTNASEKFSSDVEVKQALYLKLGRLQLVLDSGLGASAVPMLLLESRLTCDLANWSGALFLQGQIECEINFYNRKLDIWEPLLEPVEMDPSNNISSNSNTRAWWLTFLVRKVGNEDQAIVGNLRSAMKKIQRDESSSSFNTTPTQKNAPSEAALSPSSESRSMTLGDMRIKVTPYFEVSVTSNEELQLTLSKTCIEVLQELGDSFAEAREVGLLGNIDGDTIDAPALQSRVQKHPYIVSNGTGETLKIQANRPLAIAGQEDEQINECVLEVNAQVYLDSHRTPIVKSSMLGLHESLTEVQQLALNMSIASSVYNLPIARAETRYFTIQDKGKNDFGIVTDVEALHGYKQITIRSPMSFHNDLSYPVEIYTRKKKSDAPVLLKRVEKHSIIYLPCSVLRMEVNYLLSFIVDPAQEYRQSEAVPVSDFFVWSRTGSETRTIVCDTGDSARHKFYADINCVRNSIFYASTRIKTLSSYEYEIHMKPSVSVTNQLPYEITVSCESTDRTPAQSRELMPGTFSTLPAANQESLLQFVLKNYMGKNWYGKLNLKFFEKGDEINIEPLKMVTQNNRNDTLGKASSSPSKPTTNVLYLGVRREKHDGSPMFNVFSPFWFINRTGRKLIYREPEIEHECEVKETEMNKCEDFSKPLLFCFKEKYVTGEKKKISLKFADSAWSKEFSPDAIASNGVIQTFKRINGKQSDVPYEIGMRIRAAATLLTKIVTFAPYYLLRNSSTRYDLRIKEDMDPSSEWLTVPRGGDVVPFWPQYSIKSRKMLARIAGTKDTTMPFSYSATAPTLLKLPNKYGGLSYDNQVSDSSSTITFGEYQDGLSAALIYNWSDSVIKYRQTGDSIFNTLKPKECVHFAWPMTYVKEPSIEIEIDGHPVQKDLGISLNRDHVGRACYVDDADKPSTSTVEVFWASFLDGVQRVLLFTSNVNLALEPVHRDNFEPTKFEVKLDIQSIGISLVNDEWRREVIYMRIYGTGAIWQWTKKTRNKFKTFSVEDTVALETKYQEYCFAKVAEERTGKRVGNTANPNVTIHSKLKVNFEADPISGLMIVKSPSEGYLRRVDEKGMSLVYRTTDHYQTLCFSLQRVQIDNQLQGSQFPNVFFPVPPPKDSEVKAFLSMTLILRHMEHSTMRQVKKANCLIQEMDVRIDQDFINGIVSIFTPQQLRSVEAYAATLDGFRNIDLQDIVETLQSSARNSMGDSNMLFFDDLVMQPLKIHVSFSLTGSTHGAAGDESSTVLDLPVEFLGLLFHSVGVTLTEVNDVVLKLNIFSRQARFMNVNELLAQFTAHYTQQVVKQLYTVVLGLDVIGNPYGLVRGIGEGVKDLFYEPYLGGVEGPEEFFQGVGTGVKSLVGHTVGGTLNAAGKISGTLGRAFASLTFDDEFQKRRRMDMYRAPKSFGEGMMYSGKHILTGVQEGVTGVFTKPIEGFQQSGVEGFFKGVGKGVLGLVAHPTTGLVDSLSGTLGSFRGAVSSDYSSQIRSTRPPRFIGRDGVLRPYNLHQAVGFQIFSELGKGRYLEKDEFVDCLFTDDKHDFLLMLTDQRIIFLNQQELLSGWHEAWSSEYKDMKAPPVTEGKFVKILFREEKKSSFIGMFSSSTKGFKVPVGNETAAKSFVKRAVGLYEKYKSIY